MALKSRPQATISEWITRDGKRPAHHKDTQLMTILVTGSTGTIGAHLLQNLAGQGSTVHALTRTPEKARFPAGVVSVKGDMLDMASMRAALKNVSTLFLLNAVTPQELTEALLTVELAKEARVRQIVYFSVFNGERFANVPHFAAKFTAERMIEASGIPATVLRPNCFMQNDAMFKDVILSGYYPFPIGQVGISMVDARDIAEVAAQVLLRRERSASLLPHEVISLVGPDILTGSDIVAIWTNALGRPVRSTGDDLQAFEQQAAQSAPGWMAMDMRLMLGRFQQDGMVGAPGDVEALVSLLGRPLRSYAEFAKEQAVHWQA
jgi:uncharacterized protein YbjT (DUF2867 family)